MTAQKITPFITFVDQAEEAVQLYVSIFKNSKITNTTRYPDGGKVMTIELELEGIQLIALNGGDHFKLTDAFSLSVAAETQDEIDDITAKLIAGGGEQGPCGWVKDRFGLSWQINPPILGRMLADTDPAKAKRVMDAMLQMTKIDIAGLKRAYEG